MAKKKSLRRLREPRNKKIVITNPTRYILNGLKPNPTGKIKIKKDDLLRKNEIVSQTDKNKKKR